MDEHVKVGRRKEGSVKVKLEVFMGFATCPCYLKCFHMTAFDDDDDDDKVFYHSVMMIMFMMTVITFMMMKKFL